MAENSQWVTVQEAAKISGYHPDHLRELIRGGKIDAQKFSVVWQVNRESLLAYLEKAQSMGAKRGPKA